MVYEKSSEEWPDWGSNSERPEDGILITYTSDAFPESRPCPIPGSLFCIPDSLRVLGLGRLMLCSQHVFATQTVLFPTSTPEDFRKKVSLGVKDSMISVELEHIWSNASSWLLPRLFISTRWRKDGPHERREIYEATTTCSCGDRTHSSYIASIGKNVLHQEAAFLGLSRRSDSRYNQPKRA